MRLKAIVARASSQAQALPPGKLVHIDLQHFRFAAAAAECGSFRQAAELLGVGQPKLSRTIKQLEHLLGVVLFERSSGGVVPTSAGTALLRMARTVLEEFDTLVSAAKSTRNGDAGRLAIGFCTSLAAGNLRASLLDFRQKFPRIELTAVERRRVRLAHKKAAISRAIAATTTGSFLPAVLRRR